MKTEKKPGNAGSKNQPPTEDLEIGGEVYKTRLTKKFRDRKRWIRPDKRKILAVIPGTIQKVMVSEGDRVEPGDSLLILEAMKMRNEVTTVEPGIIKKIRVDTGEQVAKNQVLIEFM